MDIEKTNKELERVKGLLNKYTTFKSWLNKRENIGATKKLILETYLATVGRDANWYWAKEVKARDVAFKLDCWLTDSINVLKTKEVDLTKALDDVKIQKLQYMKAREIAGKMHDLLDKKLSNLNYHYSNRELSCLRYLIETGNIKTEAELNKYI